MLTSCLKDFEMNNIITRTQYAEVPPRVEYSLTKDGVTLVSLLGELDNWGRLQLDNVDNNN